MGLLAYVAFLSSLSFSVDVIGIYGAPPKAYQDVKSLGIEAVVVDAASARNPSVLQENIDAAHAAGLKVILGFYESGFDDIEMLKLFHAYKNHPAVAYWYLAHAPDQEKSQDIEAHNGLLERLEILNTLIHSSDFKKRPTIIYVSPQDYIPHPKIHGKAYSAFKDKADILAVMAHKDIPVYLAQYVAVELKDKPWWGVIPIELKGSKIKKHVEHFLDVGASGLLFTAYQDKSGFNLAELKEPKEAIKEIIARIRKSEGGAATSGAAAPNAAAAGPPGPLTLPGGVMPSPPTVNPANNANPPTYIAPRINTFTPPAPQPSPLPSSTPQPASTSHPPITTPPPGGISPYQAEQMMRQMQRIQQQRPDATNSSQ